MKEYFKDFDFSGFWEEDELKEYESDPFNDELLISIENELGYKLPESYIKLMKIKNGGILNRGRHPTKTPTSWSENHIYVSAILGIGREKSYSLCGDLGSQFMINEWEYPAYGVYFGECPSAGHDMILFDYRKCGKKGEPKVVHVDQELDYKITYLAKDFEIFIRGLY